MEGAAKPALTGIELGADHGAWVGAGFTVADARLEVGGVAIEFTPDEVGVASLSFDSLPEGVDSIDGIEVSVAPLAGHAGHDNGSIQIDQVVIATPDFERTAAALSAAGLPLKREITRPLAEDEDGEIRQGFVRAGSAVIELVTTRSVPEGPAHVWGLGFISERFDEAVAELEGVIGSPREAFQPGRRIATFSRDARLGLPVVLLDPEPSR